MDSQSRILTRFRCCRSTMVTPLSAAGMGTVPSRAFANASKDTRAWTVPSAFAQMAVYMGTVSDPTTASALMDGPVPRVRPQTVSVDAQVKDPVSTTTAFATKGITVEIARWETAQSTPAIQLVAATTRSNASMGGVEPIAMCHSASTTATKTCRTARVSAPQNANALQDSAGLIAASPSAPMIARNMGSAATQIPVSASTGGWELTAVNQCV